jgi:alkaline phosphatase D
MKKFNLFLLGLLLFSFADAKEDEESIQAAQMLESNTLIEKIAIGSCHNQKTSRTSPIWKHMAEEKPNLVILMGDNVYADTYDPDEFRKAYRKLKAIPSFQSLFKSIPMLFIWDDHDYGLNDDGRDEHPNREQAQRIFVEELQVPTDRRVWKEEGIYDAYVFGPEGKQTQIILLDTRSFRSPLKLHREGRRKTVEGAKLGKYVPNNDSESTLLGKEQWNWLETQLRIPAQLRVIVSSIQVLSNEHGWEAWGNFPHERERLFRLIRDTGAQGVLLLSGDRHMSEFSRLPISDPLSPGYPITEFTSSSINMSGFDNSMEPNPYRVSGTKPVCKNNYGLIQINWEEDDAQITLTIKDEKNNLVLSEDIRLSDLTYRHE